MNSNDSSSPNRYNHTLNVGDGDMTRSHQDTMMPPWQDTSVVPDGTEDEFDRMLKEAEDYGRMNGLDSISDMIELPSLEELQQQAGGYIQDGGQGAFLEPPQMGTSAFFNEYPQPPTLPPNFPINGDMVQQDFQQPSFPFEPQHTSFAAHTPSQPSGWGSGSPITSQDFVFQPQERRQNLKSGQHRRSGEGLPQKRTSMSQPHYAVDEQQASQATPSVGQKRTASNAGMPPPPNRPSSYDPNLAEGFANHAARNHSATSIQQHRSSSVTLPTSTQSEARRESNTTATTAYSDEPAESETTMQPRTEPSASSLPASGDAAEVVTAPNGAGAGPAATTPSPFSQVPAGRVQLWTDDFTSFAAAKAWFEANKEQIKKFEVRNDDYESFDESKIMQLAQEIYRVLFSTPAGNSKDWELKVQRFYHANQNNALKELSRLMGTEHGRKMAQYQCLLIAQAIVDVHGVGVPESHLLSKYKPSGGHPTDTKLKCSERATSVIQKVKDNKVLALRLVQGEHLHLVRNPTHCLAQNLLNVNSNGKKATNHLSNDPQNVPGVLVIDDNDVEEDTEHPALAALKRANPKKATPKAANTPTPQSAAQQAQVQPVVKTVTVQPSGTSTGTAPAVNLERPPEPSKKKRSNNDMEEPTGEEYLTELLPPKRVDSAQGFQILEEQQHNGPMVSHTHQGEPLIEYSLLMPQQNGAEAPTAPTSAHNEHGVASSGYASSGALHKNVAGQAPMQDPAEAEQSLFGLGTNESVREQGEHGMAREKKDWGNWDFQF